VAFLQGSIEEVKGNVDSQVFTSDMSGYMRKLRHGDRAEAFTGLPLVCCFLSGDPILFFSRSGDPILCFSLSGDLSFSLSGDPIFSFSLSGEPILCFSRSGEVGLDLCSPESERVMEFLFSWAELGGPGAMERGRAGCKHNEEIEINY
jgi:hypothetical protein